MSDNDPSTDIVDRINDPMKFLLVDIDVAMIGALVAFGGLQTGHIFKGVVLGFVVAFYLHKFKSNHHRGYLKHLLCWYLPAFVMRLRRTPPSHLKEMIG
jgi:type IV conjugative transfer system protein TraL